MAEYEQVGWLWDGVFVERAEEGSTVALYGERVYRRAEGVQPAAPQKLCPICDTVYTGEHGDCTAGYGNTWQPAAPKPETCRRCAGEGTVFARSGYRTATCPVCDGSGRPPVPAEEPKP